MSKPDPGPGVGGFRTKLIAAMMVVVSGVTIAGLVFAQRDAAAQARRDFQARFQADLRRVQAVQETRQAMLTERCRALARRPRIHAALEDNATDLLYPTAHDEMADLMGGTASLQDPGHALKARFYRFLDPKGAVIPAPPGSDAGILDPSEEQRIGLKALPPSAQVAYLARSGGSDSADEVVAVPINSSDDGTLIAALVVGFRDEGLGDDGSGIGRGLLLDGRLILPGGASRELSALAARASPGGEPSIVLGDPPQLLFEERLNPGSSYPPAFEVVLYPLGQLMARQRTLFWRFSLAGAALLGCAFGASRLLSWQLSRPVEQLAVRSEENRIRLADAEADLEATSGELVRTARFSADASHQLKTPVTVLRAGLEEMLAGERLPADLREEVSDLVHQTFRLNSIIDDLLLLSRMDAGHLKIDFGRVNLSLLVEGWLDDLQAVPGPLELDIVTHLPPGLEIAGEKRYASFIVQNLLENAKKYNRPKGRIWVEARTDGSQVILCVGNTGRPIPAGSQQSIFERFHRAGAGENIPGNGLGLNLSRELARLHGGELRLVESAGDSTVFEVRFRSV